MSLKTWIFHDSFDFAHKVALINQYLNERPLFHIEQGVCTPLIFEQSMLSRSNERPKFSTFAEYIIPENKEVYAQIKKLAQFNKNLVRGSLNKCFLPIKQKEHNSQVQEKLNDLCPRPDYC